MNRLETYIVYLDDADYAQKQLAELLAQPHTKRWVFVACAPRMTRRIGKWLSHSARENWRDKWCDKLFGQFMPHVPRNDHAFCEVANGPLPEYTQMLLKDLGQAQVIDARRPKFGVEMQPVSHASVQSLGVGNAQRTTGSSGAPPGRGLLAALPSLRPALS